MNNGFDKHKTRLNTILETVLNSKYSEFYKNKYKDIKDTSNTKLEYDSFCKIPILTKDDLLDAHFKKRCFVPKEEVCCVGQSSGTTNINKILLTPISFRTRDKRLVSKENCVSKESISKFGLTSILSLLPATVNYFFSSTVYNDFNAIILPGDLGNLPGTAKLSIDYKIDGIVTFPTLLLLMAKELEAANFPLEKIRWITIFGEQISNAKTELIREKFPNAYIDSVYTSWEAFNFIGYRCNEREFFPNTFHLGSQFFCEVLDENQNPVSEGEYGNLVITDLDTDKATPLIRYSTGDVASITRTTCTCGNSHIVSLGSRDGYDSLRVFGVTFNAEVLENTIKEYLSEINLYKLVVQETKIKNEVKPKITLKINVNTSFDTIAPLIKKDVLANYFISKDKTLGYFIENNIFESFNVEPLNENMPSGKQKKIILDLDS